MGRPDLHACHEWYHTIRLHPICRTTDESNCYRQRYFNYSRLGCTKHRVHSRGRYAISWTIPPAAGWGISTGNVGDANALDTEITIPYSSFENSGGLNETYRIDVRADNDTYGYYSGWSNQVEILIGEPDTDGDGVVDDDETEGCVEDVDCDDDGTGDADDPDDTDPDVPVLQLTLTAMAFLMPKKQRGV